MSTKRRKVEVRERDLARFKHPRDPDLRLLGLAHPSGRVDIEPKQSERVRLNTLMHELMHVALPKVCETDVEKAGCLLSRILWAQGYRRVHI